MNEARRCGQCLGGSTHRGSMLLATRARTGSGRGRRRGRWRPISVAQARRRGYGREVRRCEAKHGWAEPQGTTRVSARALRCNGRAERAPGAAGVPSGFRLYVGQTYQMRTSRRASNSASRVCVHCCACVCSRSCVVRELWREGSAGGDRPSRTAVRERPQWERSRSSRERA